MLSTPARRGQGCCSPAADAENLLRDWSIAKLLAFGAHLYLLERCVSVIKQELSDLDALRVIKTIENARMFINTFEEWHQYVAHSVKLRLQVDDSGPDIVRTIQAVAESLAQHGESVDSTIPNT